MDTSAILPDRLRSCRDDAGTAMTLDPGATAAFHPRCGARLAVSGGQAWITQAGDTRDHLPGDGQAVTLAATGLVVVQNLGHDALALRCWNLRRR